MQYRRPWFDSWVRKICWRKGRVPTPRSPFLGFPRSSVGKECACSAGYLGSIPGSDSSPGEGNGNPLQYSCLQNLMNRRGWEATAHGVTRVGHDLVTKPPPPSWLLPPSTVILKKKIKSSIVCTFSSSVCHEVLGPDAMILVS